MDLEYFQEVTRHEQIRPLSDYPLDQSNISTRQRAILIDWMVGVWSERNSLGRSLCLGFDYLQRYLSIKKSVPISDLQAVGAVCFQLGSKMEDVETMEIRDVAKVCDDAYTETKLWETEKDILLTLEFNFHATVITDFLPEWDQNAMETDGYLSHASFYHLMWYLTVLCYYDYHLSTKHRPSYLAASVFTLAKYQFTGDLSCTQEFTKLTDYKLKDLLPCIQRLATIWTAGRKDEIAFTHIKDLFRSQKLSGVFNLVMRQLPVAGEDVDDF